ncbi:DUF423 domain-containing protein [Devosia sp.]|uniref:DUF423 domain-containing protein n=1 Tax=Devosia sp. TaxID=1871048 RepID=UPI002FC875BB
MTQRLVLAVAGMVGAIGVVAAAAASHDGNSRNLAAIATICLAHGPALLALGLAARGRMLNLAAVLLALGSIIFAGDLGMREWLGRGLFAGAAPLGGGFMIGGWLAIVAGALFGRRD